MWLPKGHRGKKVSSNGLVAVAINKDKGSQQDLLLGVQLMITTTITIRMPMVGRHPPTGYHEKITRELFLSFHCFCTRKDINCYDVKLEGADVVKTLTEYISSSGIENLVLEATSRHGFIRYVCSSRTDSWMRILTAH
ncbi:hypothetical protein SAY86_028759 [Trapa natans]|uniref:RING-type E3 ubiquitin transferase n=1 Tax=Trapa natans TaxID=22666 RepID=A0AAN7MJ70_TRANT|nr:hypothetical protein SAY86_028759 [Trapa natans]